MANNDSNEASQIPNHGQGHSQSPGLGHSEAATANGVTNGVSNGFGQDAETNTKQDNALVVDGSHPDTANLLPPSSKKKKKRPASKRGQAKPTGMEEFYADAPMTLEEVEEDKGLYDPVLPFVSRILSAIQRFERTRKLTPERRNAFHKWLAYGGFDVGPNMFTSAQNTKELDKVQLAAALSNVSISSGVQQIIDDASSESKYAIDFLGCMRGFLSRRATNVWPFDKEEEVKLVTSTLERFMDYLMQHGVCPEYAEQVLATRDFCRQASGELWKCVDARRWLPGDFNIACSTLFGGSYGRDYAGETSWASEDDDVPRFVGLTPEKATQIFGFAIAGAAPEHIYQKYAQLTDNGEDSLKVEKTISGQGFEITGIEPVTTDCKELYTTKSEDFRPVGIVHAMPWRDPEAPPEDLTEEERRERAKPTPAMSYLFFVEEIILEKLSVGQKVLATIRKLNCGVWFFDEFLTIYPNFEEYLLNEMMIGYKAPKPHEVRADGGSEDTYDDDDELEE